MYNICKMKKNILSDNEREINAISSKKIPRFVMIILSILSVMYFFKIWGFEGSIQSLIMTRFFIIIFLILAPFLPLSIPLLIWYSNIPNPKYISWDIKGIYIINQLDKKEFISWGIVKSIRKTSEYGGVSDKYPDYVMEIKGEARKRNVNEEIGKEVKKYFESIKNEIEHLHIPFYKTASFKIFIYLLITHVIIFSIGIYYTLKILNP